MKSLRALRAERLLSTRRLAELAGASNKTIVQIENGRQTPAFVTIEKISRVLEVEPREVAEFARAINQRSGIATADEGISDRRQPIHVFCLSLGATQVFHPLSRRLLESERFGVTAATGIALRPEQIACCLPDLVVLDIDTQPGRMRDLLVQLRSAGTTISTPMVLTSRRRQHLDDFTSELGESDRSGIVVAPLTTDLGELLTAIETLSVEPSVTHATETVTS